jgi:hypothetical protein
MTSPSAQAFDNPDAIRASRVGAIGVAVLLVMAFRSGHALIAPQFWAEDATVFFREQIGHSLPLLARPYAGYLHFLPRMVAWLADMGAVRHAPLIYNLSAWLITSASITFAIVRLERHVPMMVSFAALLLVPAGGEAIASLTNVQWYTQLALALLCLLPVVDQSGPYRRSGRLLVVAVLALTGPFSILVFLVGAGVLLAAHALRRSQLPWLSRPAAAWPAPDLATWVVLAACAAIQMGCVMLSPPTSAAAPTGWMASLGLGLLSLLPIHVFVENFLPTKAWLVIWVFLAGGLFLRRRIAWETRLLLLSLLAVAMLQIVMATHLKSAPALAMIWWGDRYFVLGRSLFWMVAWCALANCLPDEKRHEATALVLAFIALVSVCNINTLRKADFEDLHWSDHASMLGQPGQHVIPINPRPWTITITTDATGKMQ